MIRGTNANAKLQSLEISEAKAIAKILIYSTSATSPAQAFQFYAVDEDTKDEELLSANVYWIDRASNYDSAYRYVDVLKYKEIYVEIDISKQETAEVVDNHWFRRCHIAMKNLKTHEIAWTSEELLLQSASFDLPTVASVFAYSESAGDDKHNVVANICLNLKDDTNWNYASQNFDVIMQLLHPGTNIVIEQVKYENNSKDFENNVFKIKSSNVYDVGNRFIVKGIIATKNGKVYSSKSVAYLLWKTNGNIWIKTEDGIKQALGVYIADSIEEEEAWL